MNRTLLLLCCTLCLTALVGSSSASAGDGDADGPKHQVNATIKADIQALKAAFKQFREDRESHDTAKLKADHEAVKAARTKLHEDIESLRKEHNTDA
jgi:hypothetical protein